MYKRIFVLLAISAILGGCRANPPRAETPAAQAQTEEKPARRSDENSAATPAGGSYLAGDGPGSDTPANLQNIPDAVPHAEPLHRYANRPYTVMGKTYTPLTVTGTYKERGIASWYGKKFHGQKTSIGEVYDMYGMSAAHTTLPIPSYAKVTNLSNHKSVIVRVNDRGPFLHERIIDLSYTAAAKLGLIGNGQGMVEVESIKSDDTASAPISPIYKEPIQVNPLPSDSAPSASTESSASGRVYLQLGAFSTQSGAEAFMRDMRIKLSDSGKQLSLLRKQGMVKVRIGPYSSADSARATALKLQDRLGFKPVVSF